MAQLTVSPPEVPGFGTASVTTPTRMLSCLCDDRLNIRDADGAASSDPGPLRLRRAAKMRLERRLDVASPADAGFHPIGQFQVRLCRRAGTDGGAAQNFSDDIRHADGRQFLLQVAEEVMSVALMPRHRGAEDDPPIERVYDLVEKEAAEDVTEPVHDQGSETSCLQDKVERGKHLPVNGGVLRVD